MGGPVVPSQERLLAIIELQNALAAAALTTEEVMQLVAERAAQLVTATGALVELVDGDDMVCRAAAGSSRQVGLRRSQKSVLSGRCVAERKPVRSGDGAAICVPFFHGEYVVGAMTAVGAPKTAFTDADTETLNLLAKIIAIPLHRTRSFPRPRKDNTHDPLTGLLNRRAFDERLTVEVARHKRYDQSFSLTVVDLDGFNTAADRLGEAACDELLRTIGAILTKSVRVMDACFRLGGAEFAIIMPGTSIEGANVLAERCRSQMTDANLDGVTARLGVIEAGEDSVEQLVERADAALKADR